MTKNEEFKCQMTNIEKEIWDIQCYHWLINRDFSVLTHAYINMRLFVK